MNNLKETKKTKEIIILSGKGGTGKTSLAACFSYLAQRTVISDVDVDAPDLHLILKPQIMESHPFYGGKKAVLNREKCILCGKCKKLCRFDAIIYNEDENSYKIDLPFCEGCGVCSRFCPAGAITMEDNLCGEWFKSSTRMGTMVHARLEPGGENSGKLVTLIRRESQSIARKEESSFIITDGSPGIGCPVIASLTGADFVVMVTEPTVSGIHDLIRIAGLILHFRIPCGVIINRFDINQQKTAEIQEFVNKGFTKENNVCDGNSCYDDKISYDDRISLLGRIPYDKDMVKAQIQGLSLVEYSQGETTKIIKGIWNRIVSNIC